MTTPQTLQLEFFHVDNSERKTLQVSTNHTIKVIRDSVARLFKISDFELRANGEKSLSE
jgi:hypothetical protein